MINEIGGCLIRIQEMSDSLSPKEQKVAQCIVSNPRKVVNMSIDDLATKCDVSTSTVVRLCKTLHYSGFKELCRHLCCDLSSGADMNEQFEDIHPGDDPETIMRNICLGSIRAIENTMSVMTTDALHQAVDALCLAKRIDFYGIGTSGLVALDAGTKFTRINKFVIAHADPHNQMLSAATLRKQDVAVLISYSGETNDILNVAHEIRKQGTIIITLTQYSKNSLAALADINLYCVSTETLLRSGAMSSRIAQLTIIDILFASVCSRNFDEVKPHLERSRIITRRAHVQPGE
ncbi:MAG: MurR/RpiR family transcriptional regulator [Christensenellales bacterium]|jgi:DNA-binding MurR/RpiR family transcriptional regulator